MGKLLIKEIFNYFDCLEASNALSVGCDAIDWTEDEQSRMTGHKSNYENLILALYEYPLKIEDLRIDWISKNII